MKEFDYIIIGGGCAGLSLAYELNIHSKLQDKTLAIIEPREEYERDKWNITQAKKEEIAKDTMFKSTRELFEKNNQWTEKEIINRSELLADWALKRWQY